MLGKRISKRNADEKAEVWLLSWLARREYSVCEASSRLVRKGVTPARVEQVMERFLSEGIISNQRFAESLVRTRVARGQGPLLVGAELQRRGVEREIASEVMSEFKWRDIGQAAKIKRFGKENPADGHEFDRQARFLAGRGFPMDIIFSVLGR